PAVLAVAVAHLARTAAGRAATVRDPRRAQAARRASEAFAGSVLHLERLMLPDRAAELAERSQQAPLPVPGTATPAERAWALGWHLLAAAARVHRGASVAGRPGFGERQAAATMTLARQALRELEALVSPSRRIELRAALGPDLALDAQL